MIRFAGFEIDPKRSELRRPDGVTIKVRSKTFEVLRYLCAHARQVVTKQELMAAVWPSVHVSDDSLFQCISELRAALGDANRQLIRAVPARGYLFDADVVEDRPEPEIEDAAEEDAVTEEQAATIAAEFARRPLPRYAIGLLAIAGLFALALVALAPTFLSTPRPTTLSVMPIVDSSSDGSGRALAMSVAEALIDGFALIDNVSVIAATTGTSNASMIISSELSQHGPSWTLRARLVDGETGKVHGVATVSVDGSAIDDDLLQSRLVGGVGDQLARSLNAVLEPGKVDAGNVSTSSKVAIQQAEASINQTSRERFTVAETMLKDALAAEPSNVDVQVALAALQLRGMQLSWYEPSERDAVEDSARTLLAEALKVRPHSIAALTAHCRLLSTATEFAESLVACGQVLSFDPWDGASLYLIGLGQLQLGRFEDALATFTLADRYDSPAVSRWTWLLGAGWTCLLLDRNEEALAWIQRSISITPASGRSHLLLAVAYDRLGRRDEALAAIARALQLRPGATVASVDPARPSSSPATVAAGKKINETLAGLGLPPG